MVCSVTYLIFRQFVSSSLEEPLDFAMSEMYLCEPVHREDGVAALEVGSTHSRTGV